MLRAYFLLLTVLAVGGSPQIIKWQSSVKPVLVDGSLVHPTRLLVKLQPEASVSLIQEAHQLAGGKIIQNLPQIGWQIVEVPAGRLTAARQSYLASPGILRADYDNAKLPAYVPNDEYFSGQWNLWNIKVPQAWDTVKGDPSVVVAVLDTGVDYNHPDLSANVWHNSGEIPNNGKDDDNNGYVDDVLGWDFAYSDNNPMDDYGHGTACAGIIGAVQDNGIGVSGIAPRCQIMCIKAANSDGYFYDTMTVPAYLYAADMGARVFSMSYFTDKVIPAEEEGLDYAWSKGVVLCAAAGNASHVYCFYPGAYENVIGVAAVNPNNQISSFSDWGSWVDTAAPGESIWTITAGGGYTSGFAGTSAATPHVAGVAALIASAKLSASNYEIRSALEDTCHALDQYPYGEFTQYGLVDAEAGVARIRSGTNIPRSGRFNYVSPIGGGPLPKPGFPNPGHRLTIWGRGFEDPNVVQVLTPTSPVQILSRDRQKMVILVPRGVDTGTILVRVNGANVGSFNYQPIDIAADIYVPTDASGEGGFLLGGFNEFAKVDGKVVTCKDRGDGYLIMKAICQKVTTKNPQKVTVTWTRKWTNATGKTEYVLLYDWSSGSYPYGYYTEIIGRTIPNANMETFSASLSDAWKYVDVDGVMYLYIYASGVGTSQLDIDNFQVIIE